jgi:hypothetical protein
MAYGTANVDVIQSSTTGTPVQFNDGSGTQIGTLCRAWANFNGVSSVTVNASFNVSSITRSSSGVYVFNMTKAMPDTGYSVVTAYNFAEYLTGANNSSLQTVLSGKTSSSVTVRAWYGSGGGAYDTSDLNVAVFR